MFLETIIKEEREPDFFLAYKNIFSYEYGRKNKIFVDLLFLRNRDRLGKKGNPTISDRLEIKENNIVESLGFAIVLTNSEVVLKRIHTGGFQASLLGSILRNVNVKGGLLSFT